MKKYKIGYTQGTYDMFHIGHLNLLRNAKTQCEKLVVGINTNALVMKYKNKYPVIDEQDRAEIVKELKSVDEVILCNTLSKISIWEIVHFDAIFIGDDWKGNARWIKTEKELAPLDVNVVYLPHTDGICSTFLRAQEQERIKE